jgi:prepilin-type N-terminal cleavage/methylation domain-containing protein
MININPKQNQGFTMIETLVAVAILMISIAGPLTIAQKGLVAAIYARDQVTASFLAQDVMEFVKNKRDEDVQTGLSNWLDTLGICTEENSCIVDTTNGYIGVSNDTVLYHDGGGYRTSGTIPSQFSREFYIVPTPGNEDDEVKAVVIVSWRNGSVENVVTMENELFKIDR